MRILPRRRGDHPHLLHRRGRGDWDYAPAGSNQITEKPFEGLFEQLMMTLGPTQIGGVYRKAIYREYTDSTFGTPKPRPPGWEHLGILGPL